MKLRGGTALVVVILALALGSSGCGGSNAKKPSAKAEAAAEARWRTGLLQWRRSMLRALNGMSIILATDGSLVLLKDPHSPTSARLDALTSTLDNCSAAVQPIGAVPTAFAIAHQLALVACKTLGQGDELVTGRRRQDQTRRRARFARSGARRRRPLLDGPESAHDRGARAESRVHRLTSGARPTIVTACRCRPSSAPPSPLRFRPTRSSASPSSCAPTSATRSPGTGRFRSSSSIPAERRRRPDRRPALPRASRSVRRARCRHRSLGRGAAGGRRDRDLAGPAEPRARGGSRARPRSSSSPG